MNPIPYGRQQITEEDKQAVLEVLESDFLTQGPAVEKFEQALSSFLQAKYVVAVSNGTAALHLAALALGVKPGDKVLVTTNSFAASANCIRYCGGDVEFVDIDPITFCLDFIALEEKLKAAKPNTYKGIVCVDLAGYAVDFERLRTIADKYGIWIIEDACHAVGAQFLNSQNEWVYSGNSRYADMSVFSFHPVKHIATGEGGAITARTPELYEKLKVLRTHGIVRDSKLMTQNDGPWYYQMQQLGFNYRISDILCALGASQMKRIEPNLKRRREIADIYNVELNGTDLVLPSVPASVRHAYHLYVIQSDHRDRLYAYLRERNIYSQVHYIPIHTMPYYRELYGAQKLPVAESYYSKALSLPMFHALTESSQAYVIEALKRYRG